MPTADTNAAPEQKKPADVLGVQGDRAPADEQSKAPSMMHGACSKDASEKPVVNPVTGSAF